MGNKKKYDDIAEGALIGDITGIGAGALSGYVNPGYGEYISPPILKSKKLKSGKTKIFTQKPLEKFVYKNPKLLSMLKKGLLGGAIGTGVGALGGYLLSDDEE